MRTQIVTLVLASTLAVGGCKKKAEPEAPADAPMAEAPAAAKAVMAPEVSWLGATYEGGHMSDSVGTITFKASVTNGNAEQAVTISMVSVGAKGETGRVCIAKHEEGVTVRPSSTAEIEITGDCMYSKLPDQGDITLMGTMKLDLGEGPTDAPISGTVAITR